ncbi:MAG: hypothetical protein QOD72_2912, partial [Acidimicrobiaceae bacterium]|nr:hypothetical protein [Acidimicrobiaceae bacterium]
INQTVTDALVDVKLNAPSSPIMLSDSSGATAWFVVIPTKAGDPDAKAIVAVLKAAAAKVSVDTRYGHWDTETQTVTAGDATSVG